MFCRIRSITKIYIQYFCKTRISKALNEFFYPRKFLHICKHWVNIIIVYLDHFNSVKIDIWSTIIVSTISTKFWQFGAFEPRMTYIWLQFIYSRYLYVLLTYLHISYAQCNITWLIFILCTCFCQQQVWRQGVILTFPCRKTFFSRLHY